MPDTDLDLQLRYVGSRFDGGKLPVDVLQDLAAFRELLVAIARKIWLEDHPKRERVPAGFDASLALSLVDVTDGSAVPKLHWEAASNVEMLPGLGSSDELKVILERSYSEATQLIHELGTTKTFHSIQPNILNPLRRVGANLRDGERVEFLGSQDSQSNVIYLDQHRRANYFTRARENLEAVFVGVGILDETAYTAGLCRVLSQAYGNVEIPIPPEQLKADFDGKLTLPVHFSVQAKTDEGYRLRQVTEVFDVSFLDTSIYGQISKAFTRLEQLSQLSPGWHDGEGAAISDAAISSATKLLEWYPELTSEYRIYPSDSGGLSVELSRGSWEYVIDISSKAEVEIVGVEIGGTRELEGRRFTNFTEKFIETLDQYLEIGQQDV